MATKSNKTPLRSKRAPEGLGGKEEVLESVKTTVPKWREAEVDEDKLDPAEEKMLDNILKGVVIFILGWLGLSILLVIGGYFGMWK